MINDADLDGNKVLDFEEFLAMMSKKVRTAEREQLKGNS